MDYSTFQDRISPLYQYRYRSIATCTHVYAMELVCARNSEQEDSKLTLGRPYVHRSLRPLKGLGARLASHFVPFKASPSDIIDPDDPDEVSVDDLVNAHSMVVFKLRTEARLGFAIAWGLVGTLLVFLELCMCLAIIFTAWVPRCLFDTDCRLGMVCVARVNASMGDFPFCDFCESHVRNVSSLWGHERRGERFELTRRRQNDFGAETAEEFCLDALRTPDVELWAYPPLSIDRCPHIRFLHATWSALDIVVVVISLCITAVMIGKDQQQATFNAHLRKAWFPPATQHWRPAILKLNEVLLDYVNAFVIFALLSLMLTGSSLRADETLLNSLSILFVLEIDDSFTDVLVGATEQGRIRAAIARACQQTDDRRPGTYRIPFREMHIQRSVYIVIAYTVIMASFITAFFTSCMDFVVLTALFAMSAFIVGVGLIDPLVQLIVAEPQEGRNMRRNARMCASSLGWALIESILRCVLMQAIYFRVANVHVLRFGGRGLS